jgi:hypothetical protein
MAGDRMHRIVDPEAGKPHEYAFNLVVEAMHADAMGGVRWVECDPKSSDYLNVMRVAVYALGSPTPLAARGGR